MNAYVHLTMLCLLACIGSAVATASHAEAPDAKDVPIALDTHQLEWESSSAPGFPEGAMRKIMHRNPESGAAALLRSHPKGYVEPRHYHSTAAHSVYLLKGRVRIGDLVAGPGYFFHAPAGSPHGPIEALDDIEFLLWTDGPLDLHIVDARAAGVPAESSDGE